MKWLFKKIVGTKNERDSKRLNPQIQRINELEVSYQALSDDELKGKTAEFQARLEQGETLDDLMCEAFATVKNTCRRLCGTQVDVCGQIDVWNMIPFNVQLVGGIVLHQGRIAEMATGEGKTLMATLPVYLNALTGKNVHVITVNDYLARRDAAWMGAVYNFLGLTVGCIQNQMPPSERREEYAKNITYGTNSEFGFDYLRDKGMAFRPEDQVQREYFYAIIDEIDSILIDEARTPLIISGPAPYSSHQYAQMRPAVEGLVRRQRDLCNKLVQEARSLLDSGNEESAELLLYKVNQGMPKNKQLLHLLEDPSIRKVLEGVESRMLTDMHKDQARELREELFFTIDEKGHDAHLTEKGCEALSPNDPEAYVLPDLISALSEIDGDDAMAEEDKLKRRQQLQDQFAEKSERIHNVDQLIRAYCSYEKDVQYVVQNNQVIIVDEFTGRLMPGRRWSDGLHQAIEAKEKVKIERETQTLATITIQNYFRMYEKLAGMTGTAETEADEFSEIYNLDVMVVPTNRPVRRVDFNDMIYKTKREKYNAVVDEIEACRKRNQPVLVGTVSVDVSEILSRILRRRNIPHTVLNAKNHQHEAEVVARAGQPGAVTIATNMAGRGTDIKLGEGVVYLDRDLVESSTRLEDKVDGDTLLHKLEENPCGLHVIGSARHESRRIDRQLRGRAARQGDPGSSRFYVSLEDDLMRLFGSERVAKIMERLGLEEGQVLEHPWLNKSIERAQRRVEQHNFLIRKRTLEYDDVMNKQREVIYSFRSDIVGQENVRENLYDVVHDVIINQADEVVAAGLEEALDEFLGWVNATFPIGMKRDELAPHMKDAEALTKAVFDRVHQAYELKVRLEHEEALVSMERMIMLQAIDTHWQEYLRSMDSLRQGVGLRAYGQRDPLIEYKHEAYEMFSVLMDKIKEEIVTKMFRSATSMESMTSFLQSLPQTYVHQETSAMEQAAMAGRAQQAQAPSSKPSPEGADKAMNAALHPVHREGPKVGRNDPCPCGSGKKYKKCCGQG